ncbi:MAG TPA: hypothetical protein VKM55_04295 [Candidatus Lokiarchaeia archaeon]|nr:hypothetical protein [Candidatus Lokiarchaeia archaeon]
MYAITTFARRHARALRDDTIPLDPIEAAKHEALVAFYRVAGFSDADMRHLGSVMLDFYMDDCRYYSFEEMLAIVKRHGGNERWVACIGCTTKYIAGDPEVVATVDMDAKLFHSRGEVTKSVRSADIAAIVESVKMRLQAGDCIVVEGNRRLIERVFKEHKDIKLRDIRVAGGRFGDPAVDLFTVYYVERTPRFRQFLHVSHDDFDRLFKIVVVVSAEGAGYEIKTMLRRVSLPETIVHYGKMLEASLRKSCRMALNQDNTP